MVNSSKLKGRIIEFEMTQAEIAEKCGISQPALNQKINNLRPMDLDEAYKLAKLLDIPDNEYGLYFFV